jgi:peptidoglycan/xylan/chitin deacetylase (PgdA/CDA1 family)
MDMEKNMPYLLSGFLVLFSLIFPVGVDPGQCQEKTMKEEIVSTFTGKNPREWGERVTGVKTRLNTDQKVIALTFDACGGPKRGGYHVKLIECLRSEKIPATLFISGKWMDANRERLKDLAKEPLFELQNHGLNHKPSSVNGRSAYGIEGTKSVAEVFDEIEENAIKIQALTGRRPRYYRPGTAFSDEIGVKIANALGYEVVSFSVRGDAGATSLKNQVKRALLKARPCSIIVMHMNHPEGETAEGLMEAIPELKNWGFRFVKLSEYDLK